MNQNNRICIFEGHQEYQVSHICILNECDHYTRWCCSECLSKGIHNHNKLNNTHIMNRKEINSFVMNQYENIKKDLEQFKSSQLPFFQIILKELYKIDQSLINYRNQYYHIEKSIKNITSGFELCLSNLKEYNFQQLDDNKIKQILNISLCKFDQQNSKQQLQSSLDIIKQQFVDIEKITKEYEDINQRNIKNQIIDFKVTKYITQEIDQISGSCLNYYIGTSISRDEKYLAYGASMERILNIYDIQQKKRVREIKIDNYFVVCQFTQDSSQLYVGLNEGYVYGYNVLEDFKEIFKQQIHASDINDIITIQNQYLITFSDDKCIIKTDIQSKQLIFKLTAHTNCIIAFDYNYKDEIIVSASQDKSIKLWNFKNQSIIINKEKSHKNIIRQIQLINNNLDIFSLDVDGNLYKWKIDLIKKDLIRLRQYRDQDKIFSFSFSQVNQNLLLICHNYAKILGYQGDILNIIEHGVNDSTWMDFRQLDSLKLIQIRAFKKIILAIAQD